jgi:peptidoglycan hydrolase-like protein with peptidoglycan-binding domain
MWSSRVNLALVLIAVFAADPAFAAELNPDAINSAEPSKKSLTKDKATPAGVRLQVLLDRAHFSPGEIDGKFGENARKAFGPTRRLNNCLAPIGLRKKFGRPCARTIGRSSRTIRSARRTWPVHSSRSFLQRWRT